MTTTKMECWLQITAGHGPAECAWAVVQVLERIREEAHVSGIDLNVVEMEPGSQPGMAQSALIRIASSHSLMEFVSTWQGTVQWIAKSPFRPAHRRRNWFVGIEVLEAPAGNRFDLCAVKFETMRASGPGGQHVNRTESAVRVTHLPTGIQASASEERSQHRNRKLALARLVGKLEALETTRQGEAKEKRWRAHQQLQRGNPVRVLIG